MNRTINAEFRVGRDESGLAEIRKNVVHLVAKVCHASRTYGGQSSSVHPGGTHFLLGDGAVKFMNQSMDHSLYSVLMRIRTGEPDSMVLQ